MSDITFEPTEQPVDELDAYFNSLEAATPADVEMNQADFDALIADLANADGLDINDDISNLYLQGEPDLTELDTQEVEVDPQAVEAWLDSLEPTQSFEMEL